MTLASEIAADVDRLILANTNDFAESVSYTVKATSVTTTQIMVIDAVVDRISGQIVKRYRRAIMSSTTITPVPGDTGTFGGIGFRVAEVASGGPGAWVLLLDLA